MSRYDFRSVCIQLLKEKLKESRSADNSLDLEEVSPTRQAISLKMIDFLLHRFCLFLLHHRYPGLVLHPANSLLSVIH
jgi:hypothetical protein